MLHSTLEVRKLLPREVRHPAQGQQAPKTQNQSPGCQTSKPPPLPTNMSVWSKEKSKFLNNPEERREEAQPLQQPENPKTDCRAASGGGVGDIS